MYNGKRVSLFVRRCTGWTKRNAKRFAQEEPAPNGSDRSRRKAANRRSSAVRRLNGDLSIERPFRSATPSPRPTTSGSRTTRAAATKVWPQTHPFRFLFLSGLNWDISFYWFWQRPIVIQVFSFIFYIQHWNDQLRRRVIKISYIGYGQLLSIKFFLFRHLN